jgi:maltose O-acetyltransferase
VAITFKRRITRDIVVNQLLASMLLPMRWRPQLMRKLGFRLGEGVVIKPGCFFVGTDCAIGEYSGLEDDVRVLNETTVTIGSRTGIGQRTLILTGSHEIGNGHQRAGDVHPLPVTIGDGCFIGAGVTILPGVTIGDGCVISAGAVVTASCAPHGIYMGNPAELIRQLKPPTGPRPTGPPA